MTIRIRLLAALTYVLLLAIIALGVPLAINLSARVNAEVRTQALAQADLVAATAADLLGQPERAELATLARGAASIRGRVLVVNVRGIVLADSAAPPQVGVSYRAGNPHRATGSPGAGTTGLEDAGSRDPGHRGPDRPATGDTPGRFASPRASQRCTAPCAAPSSVCC